MLKWKRQQWKCGINGNDNNNLILKANVWVCFIFNFISHFFFHFKPNASVLHVHIYMKIYELTSRKQRREKEMRKWKKGFTLMIWYNVCVCRFIRSKYSNNHCHLYYRTFDTQLYGCTYAHWFTCKWHVCTDTIISATVAVSAATDAAVSAKNVKWNKTETNAP